MGRIISFENSKEKQKMISEYYYFLYLIKDVKLVLDKYFKGIDGIEWKYENDNINLSELLGINSYDVNFVLKMTKEIFVFGLDIKYYYNSVFDILYCAIFEQKYKDIVKDYNHYLEYHLYK